MSTAERLPVPEIRPMRPDDIDVVMEIEQASFSTPWSRRSFQNLLGRSDADLCVAVSDECVVGYAGVIIR